MGDLKLNSEERKLKEAREMISALRAWGVLIPLPRRATNEQIYAFLEKNRYMWSAHHLRWMPIENLKDERFC